MTALLFLVFVSVGLLLVAHATAPDRRAARAVAREIARAKHRMACERANAEEMARRA